MVVTREQHIALAERYIRTAKSLTLRPILDRGLIAYHKDLIDQAASCIKNAEETKE